MQDHASHSINASAPMISVEDAEKAIAAFPVSPIRESVPLAAALDRYLATDVFSPRDIPEFDKAAMDGYAYVSGDASPALRMIETIAAGAPPRLVVTPGQCAKIMTGAMMPAGADRVVRRECTREEKGVVTIVSEDASVNVRRRGEDLQAGKLVLASGQRLRPVQVALLASLGMSEVPVARPPRVGVITTGSELAAPGTPLAPGQIYDSNSYSLDAQIREAGALPLMLGRVADNEDATVKTIEAALSACDVLILSGGVSAGDFDYVPAAMKRAGLTPSFEKVAVQPGMPTVFAVRNQQSCKGTAEDGQPRKGTAEDGQCAFGLPGNPVSTFVIFDVLIKPLLLRMMGNHSLPPRQRATFVSAFSRSNASRTAFIPVILRDGNAELVSYHGSGHLHALAKANGLLHVAAGLKAIAPGSIVDVRLL